MVNTAIHQFIERQALLNPDMPAVVYDGKTLSYKELNERSNQLAHFLIANGVVSETLVGISIKRSLEMIVSVLGTLKAGGAYVPIDSDYPKERIHYMLENSGIKLLLTQKSLLKQISESDINKICIDTNRKEIKKFAKNNPLIAVKPTDLAYVLYTSGSTGNPKGVMVTHASLIHAYYGWEDVYQLHPTDSHLQMANFSFDVFSGDMVRALCSGGKLVLCPREILLVPERLFNLIENEKINFAEFVPTVLRRLIEYIEQNELSLKCMRLLICGSDTWSMHEYNKLQCLCAEETRVINSYGVTEATIDSTYFESETFVNEHFLTNHSVVPIGKPFPNTEILFLDEMSNRVPDGEIGEMHIGGGGLARGYHNMPEMTAKKFIAHPFSSTPGAMLYKTGDLGRFLPNGNIEFIGRIDTQVKLRGMRIELSDIENALNCHAIVRESLVMLSAEQDSQHQRIVAYIVLDRRAKPNVRELRNFLQERLPHYMIPSVFIRLDALPLMPNGKLDRRALKEKALLKVSSNYVAPRDSVEKKLTNTWKKLLRIKKIGVFDHFFDLGGDSFLMAQLLSEVEHEYCTKISLCEIPRTLTVADLAGMINRAVSHCEEPKPNWAM